MERIVVPGSEVALKKDVHKLAPGWTIANCGPEMEPGLRDKELGRKNLLITHPPGKNAACVISRVADLPAGKKTTLKLTVGHHPAGDWDLVIRVDAREIARKTVGANTANHGWLDVSVDLSRYQGKSILLELCNQASGNWCWEGGYWNKISIESN
jgi:hypothetical protein